MRLAEFILENMERILAAWEDFARANQPPDGDMNPSALRDHAEAMLKVVALDLHTPQTARESEQKSQGLAPEKHEPTAAQLHADERLRSGFAINLLVAEYRALRASVLALWMKDSTTEPCDLEDMLRFNEAIDQALAESVHTYSALVVDSQDTFLGILGHDLRSPLQSISVGAAYLMRTGDANAKLIQLGARMYNSAVRMGEMLDDLLDYTKIRIGGGLNMAVQNTNLAEVLSQIVDEFRAAHPGRAIQMTVDENCIGVFDGKRIARVFQNLLGNALQYSPPDTPVEMSVRGTVDDVVFTIRNQGVPIPQAAQHSLFDPLRRHISSDADDAFSSKNLGLGLYIAKQIVLAHQGTIELISTPVVGTIFTVSLPRHAVQTPG